MNKHRISSPLIIISEHFAPSTGATAQLVTDLSNALHLKGYNINVITSTSDSSPSSYPVYRLLRPDPRYSTNIFYKSTKGLAFFTRALFWLLSNTDRHSTLLIVSNPPFIGLLGVFLRHLKGLRYCYLFQDIFPRSAILSGILPPSGPITYLFKLLTYSTIQSSSSTIVLSDDMRDRCINDFGLSQKYSVIPNWSVTDSKPSRLTTSTLRQKWGLADSLVIQYSGNYGRLHDIITILEVARLLQDHPFTFLFIGGGAKRSQVQSYINHYHLSNVLLKPYQPLELLSESLSVSDISIVSLIPGAEDTVAPSKLYGILASGTPVLLISSSSSSLSKELIHSGSAVCFNSGDVLEIQRYLLSVLSSSDTLLQKGTNARKHYTSCYGSQYSLDRYIQVLTASGILT